MGEAKRRGNSQERQEAARQRRAQEIEETRKEMNLPEDAVFAGYVVYVREKDDYLMEISEDDSAIHRKYCRTPELAARYMERERAEAIASSLPRTAVVGLLYDIGRQLIAVMET